MRVIATIILASLMLAACLIPGPSLSQETENYGLSKYNGYEVVKAELERLELGFPDICKVIVLGSTYEGRDILAMRLTDNPETEEADEPDMLIMGGHHANELPSVEVPMYILEHLVQNYSTDSRARHLVDNRDIWFVPMLNPDGREYSMAIDANWRKNMRPVDTDSDGTPEGIGADLNRNYGHLWSLQGASSDPASSIYCGPSAFSENETQAIRDLALSQNFTISLSYHTYGNIVYYPWGNSIDTVHPRKQTVEAIAQEIGQMTGYTPMEGKDAYLTTGDSDDWLYAETNCLPFTIELGSVRAVPENELTQLCENQLEPALFALEIADDPDKALLPDWTVMVYMAADAEQFLEDESWIDLNEMEVAGSTQDLNIVALHDGIGTGDSRIFKVQRDSNGFNSAIISPTVDDQDAVIPSSNEVDMSRFATLMNFVDWTTENYPARHYMLDIWGHGNGIILGFAYDKGSLMKADDLSTALNGHYLDIVGFDACSLGHFEVAAELDGKANILIGSVAEEPLAGWEYDTTFQKLVANTKMTGNELATNIVNDYLASVSVTWATLAAIDVEAFNSQVIPLLNEFAMVSADFSFWDQAYIWTARNYTDTFVQDADAVDLFEFLKNLRAIGISEPVMLRIEKLLALKDEVVIASGTKSAHPESDSMAIYFPQMGQSLSSTYATLDFAVHQWDEYLEDINSPEAKANITSIPVTEMQASTASVTVSASSSSTSLELFFRVNNGQWQTIAMNQSRGTFTGHIPGQLNGSLVDYYFFDPASNMTEPYEVKWGSDDFFNYTVQAKCDLQVVELSIVPDTELEEGNVSLIRVNVTNLGPDFTLANISLLSEKDGSSSVLESVEVLIQPGESHELQVNLELEKGTWSISAEASSLGFQDTNLTNNRAVQTIVVEAQANVTIANDSDIYLGMIVIILVLTASIPLVLLLLVSRRNRDRRKVLASKKIVSARSFIETAREFGGDVAKSNVMLSKAEEALERGNLRESEEWSRKARDEAMLAVAEKEVR